MKDLFASRRFRQGSVATAITVIVVAIVVVLNLVVTAVTDRYPLKADLTSTSLFSISEVTVDYLNGLTKEVTIYVLNDEANFSGGSTYLKQANEVIQRYNQQSGQITVTYVDLVRNPGFAAQFPEETVANDYIMVVCGDKVRVLSPYDLFDIENNYYYSTITASRAEQALTSAIAAVASDSAVTVAVLGGHNEGLMDGLRELLELNNYQMVDVNILTEEIPGEATVAVLHAPLRDYEEDELKKLDRFLENGGMLGKTLFYFASVDQPPTPNLDAFLAEWNIQVGEGVVYETDSARILSLNPYYPIVDYTESIYSESVQSRNIYTSIIISRPLYNLGTTARRSTVSLLEYAQTAGVQPLEPGEDWTAGDGVAGPIDALLLSRENATVDGERVYSNVVACGSTMAVESSFLASTTLGNGEYFLNLFNALAQREDVINIQSKQMTSAQLGLNTMQALILSGLLVVVLPLVMLIVGLVVFFRRRHL